VTDELPSRSATEPSASQLDPVLHLRRDHTLLDMLGEGYHEVAGQLERHERVDAESIREGIALHRDFLIGVHLRKERLLTDALERLPDRPRRDLVEECRRDREESERWEERVRGQLEGRGSSSGEGASPELAGLLHREADRLRDHHHHEEESIYRGLERVLPRDVQHRLVEEMMGMRSESAPIEERLAAWTSRLHPASD
jgi:hypothetical protein